MDSFSNFKVGSTSVKVVFRPKPGTKDIGYLAIRTITNRKPTFKSLGIQLTKTHWDDSKQRVKATFREHYRHLNQIIEEALEELRVTNNNLESLNKNRAVMMDYWKVHIDGCINAGTKSTRLASYNWVEKFLIEKKLEGIKFRQLTPNIVETFESYLQNKLSRRSINCYMGYWKSVINKAIREQVVDYRIHPFLNHVRLSSPQKKKKALSVEQVSSIMNHKAKPLRAYYRDMFCFQILGGGMRARDLVTLRWDNIHIHDKQFYLVYTQSKSGGKKEITYNLTHKALSFLDEILKAKESIKMQRIDSSWKGLNIQLNYLKEWEEKNKFKNHNNASEEQWGHFDINSEKRYKFDRIKKSEVEKFSINDNIEMYTEVLTEAYKEVLTNVISDNPHQFIFNNLMKDMVVPKMNNDNKIKNALLGKIAVLNRHLKLISLDLGIPKITSHHSRHTHTQMLVELNANLHHIQQSLGHSSLRTTQEYVQSIHTTELDKLSTSISSQF